MAARTDADMGLMLHRVGKNAKKGRNTGITGGLPDSDVEFGGLETLQNLPAGVVIDRVEIDLCSIARAGVQPVPQGVCAGLVS